ncbi:MAG: DUF3347 domain-containing protein [Bacteroidetes bacterium]|nr:DUF3347 domain-containing protein [Bacteroidota bacterium]MBS1610477.1 DUF3347 domain-containing protein [Bacteroidota bacterium]
MKKLVTVLLIAALLIIGAWFLFFRSKPEVDNGPIQQPLTVSKHTDMFNQSANKMLASYYDLTEAFVNWDSAAVNNRSSELKAAIDSLKLSELQRDTIIYETAVGIRDNVKSEMEGLINDKSLEEKRLAFNSLTQYVYDLLRTVRYDQSKIYFQECPMAFGDDHPGNWLSKSVDVRNPYLGTQHPKYKDKMLNCGGPRDTLNFMVADTTKH